MDKQLKQRLLGASVIVALAVIIVPEIVKQPLEQAKTLTLAEIPARPVEPTAAPGSNLALPSEVTGTAGSETGANAEAMVIAEPPLATAESVEVVIDQPVPEMQTALVTGLPGNDVQQQRNQQAEIQRQQQADDRRQAERERAARAAQRLATAVVEEPAREAKKPKSEPELPKLELISRSRYQNKQPAEPLKLDDSSNWMVQAGSFSIAQNANLLRDRLRAQRFDAGLYPVNVNGGTVYRVRVGPHSSRAESERTRDRLLREAGISGSVVPMYN